ncbi:ParB N-terminal domain-containing protein [Labrenzia sp. PHM005]|uniref:ParB/RepB/Spo0J family partition protein n=1 Tax=Labrenzia sp. PHM005 TaxID=2590016 RepID=UPI0011407373|nr:ParB N-terminal domain-containing protein [Labrenzia sp. PHM005]QDG74427.1 chromosome partitioning protein ParB [Labrenzia sp. PHM005]
MADTAIKISLIDVPENRLREFDPEWANTLAGMIQEAGHKTPIDVAANGNRFRLVAGEHRLAAFIILKRKEIACRVLTPETDQPAEELRLHEILENLGRKDFNALERCEALFELKRVYEALHPETKNGGDRKSKAIQAKRENQNEIFSFCFSAAENTGLTVRSVQIAVAIFKSLSPASREHLKGTSFADKQSDLKALAELDHETQAKVLDLILGDHPKAGSIADAKLILSGRPAPKETEKLLNRVSSILPNLPRASRFAVFRQHKKDIIDLVKKEGWLDA